jgi:hypothetical protein
MQPYAPATVAGQADDEHSHNNEIGQLETAGHLRLFKPQHR